MTEQLDYTDQVSLDDLRQLAKQEGPVWVTISMPTHRTGPETRQDPIRFRNLVSNVVGQLAEQQVDEPTCQAIKARLDELSGDVEFWRHQTGGLVVLTSGGEPVRYRLPGEVPERAVVSQYPALSVLVPFVVEDTRFRVLTLGADSVRLLEGSLNSLGEVDLGPIPPDYDTVFGHVENQKHLQHAASRDGSLYHGHSSDDESGSNATTRYLRAVAAGLDERLRGEPAAPLLLAGATAVTKEFRQISSNPAIVDQTLSGSHVKTPPHELHELAWPIVRDTNRLAVDVATERINQAWAKDQALLDTAEILRAAGEGRVDSLFLTEDAANDEPRLEQAVRLTVQMGGEVHTIDATDYQAAALLRY
ncbi:MAG: hypothetical protein WBL05_08305 [Brooklawnia sp.]|uniref:baeRF3 domain-containing protein n=1 Tax=Brooklawnia sp. TaxID=2699740 RepID=UPI003C77A73B